MSAGSSYIGAFLRDANVEYKNDDNRFGTMNVSTVLANFAESQFWINAGIYQVRGGKQASERAR